MEGEDLILIRPAPEPKLNRQLGEPEDRVTYSMPQIDPEYILAIMAQDDPDIVHRALVLYTVGVIQGISSILREHAMLLMLEGSAKEYVAGWLDAADTFDLDPPRDQEVAPAEKEDQ